MLKNIENLRRFKKRVFAVSALFACLILVFPFFAFAAGLDSAADKVVAKPSVAVRAAKENIGQRNKVLLNKIAWLGDQAKFITGFWKDTFKNFAGIGSDQKKNKAVKTDEKNIVSSDVKMVKVLGVDNITVKNVIKNYGNEAKEEIMNILSKAAEKQVELSWTLNDKLSQGAENIGEAIKEARALLK